MKNTKQNAIIEGLICLLKMMRPTPFGSNDNIWEAREKYIDSTVKLLEETIDNERT